jgi:alpha-1,2-mannosyltransferase
MSARPHKEERFMFPVYPLVPLAAALTLVALERALVVPAMAAVAAYAHSAPAGAAPRRRPVAGTSLVRTAFAGAALGAAGLVSMSRVSALIHGFSAPMHVWEVLGQHIQAHPADAATRDGLEAGSATLTATARPWLGLYNATNYRPSVPAGVKPPPRLSSPGVVVCVGKEWYRFPSHFFLPEATRKDAARHPHPDRSFREGGPAEVGFLKSNFSGLLPAPYLRKVGGSTEPRPDDFNDENREGPRKNYKFVDHCDYVIDLQLPASRTQQPRYESHFALLPAVPERASYADVLKMCKRGEDAPEPPPMPPCKCVGDEKTAARWESIYCVPFMDREASGALARAFYVPGYSESRTAWAREYSKRLTISVSALSRLQPC